MTEVMWPEAVDAISKNAKISPEDVLTLRRAVFGDGVVSDGEADMVFRLNEACPEQCVEWTDFFVESLTDYLVMQADPQGYVSESNAGWLMRKIEHDGHVESRSELDLLVKVIEKAKSSPEKLVAYALEQVKCGVLEGAGPVGRSRELEPGVVGEAEVVLLRRILYAFGGDGNIAITRAEAEILFDLNDATHEADNHASWSDLFVKAVANFLMAASGYVVPSRETALKREEWLEDRSGVSGFMSQMLAGGLRGIWQAYQRDEEMDRYARLFGRENMIAESEKISALEADWLAKRIGRDGIIHENEKALLEFIREESPSVHPALLPLIDTAA
jgi:hypothetical protein